MLHLLAYCCWTLGVASDDWPQWGGPARTNVSKESAWKPEAKSAPLWKSQLGVGYSSVAVVGGRLYTLGYDKDVEQDVLYCLDALSGAEQWVHTYPAKLMDLYHGGGTLTTPTIDGEFVYVSEREGKLACLKAKSGDLVWEKDAAKEFELALPQWGFAGSPVVLGNALILNYGTVFALDKQKGTVLWKTKKNYGDAYSTPVDAQLGGQAALVVFAGTGLVVLSAADGSELSFTEWKTQYDVNAMTPRLFGERVFISSGYGHGCALLDLGAKQPKVVWENEVMKNQMSGAVPWKEQLYGFDEKVLKCIDLAGKELWRERGLGQGALAVAGGRLLILSEDGEYLVAEADPAGFKTLYRTKVFDGGPCWTVPVLANGIAYLRNQAGELVALDHRP